MTETGAEAGRRSVPWLGIAVWAAWALALMWYLARGLLDLVVAPCEQYWYDGSGYGQADWQWTPPGVTCTYFAQGSETAITVVTYPSWGPLIIGLLLLAFPFAAVRRK